MGNLEVSQRMQTAVSVLLLTALAACGGGGGSDTGGGTTPTPTPATPQLVSRVLDASTSAVASFSADIDDAGGVVAVFVQAEGARAAALKAVVAQPGATSQAPIVGVPQAIDAAAPYNGTGRYAVSVSPNGNAVVLWSASEPCTAATYQSSGSCQYIYSARKMAGGSWETPILIGDTPFETSAVLINNRGDVMAAWPAWERFNDTTVILRTGVAWRPTGSGSFQRQSFNGIIRQASAVSSLTLDSSGAMTLVSPSITNNVTNIVAVRGTQAVGFGAVETLDTASTEATLEGMWGGVNGQVVVFWQHSDGGSAVRMATVLDSPTGSWSTSSLGAPATSTISGRARGVVTDAGNFIWYDLERCSALKRSGGQWQAASSLPGAACTTAAGFTSALSRTGDVFGAVVGASTATGNTGQWMAFDGATNTLVQSFGSASGEFLLGVPSTVGGLVLVAENGVGAVVSLNGFDELPSSSRPAGIAGAQANLWLTYVKLP